MIKPKIELTKICYNLKQSRGYLNDVQAHIEEAYIEVIKLKENKQEKGTEVAAKKRL